MKVKDRRVPGERNLAAGMLVDAVGTGMYVPFSLVFFQRITGLPLPTIGTVLTVAGLLAMSAMPVGGWAVDRFGARRVRLALYLVRGLGFLAFPLGTTLPVFALVATLTAAGCSGLPRDPAGPDRRARPGGAPGPADGTRPEREQRRPRRWRPARRRIGASRR